MALLPAACLFAIGIHLQPLYGDLTRIGAYSEREFGWNDPQRRFRHPLRDVGRYERYYDVVVLGDSFSTGKPDVRWQNYLAAAAGWSVLTLDINQTTVDEVLSTPAFHTTPPRLFVLQMVERNTPRWVGDQERCPAALADAPRLEPPQAHPLARDFGPDPRFRALTSDFARPTGIEEIKLDYVKNYLWRNFQREVLGGDPTDVVKVELGKPAPFSSANNSAMLVYRDDLRKMAKWEAMGVSQMACRLLSLRKKAEANGHTRFVLVLSPDKLTAYSDFLREVPWRDASRLAELSEQLATFAPRVDLALREAIRRGERDVYLPDDTHWGSTGHRIAAETLLAFIKAPE